MKVDAFDFGGTAFDLTCGGLDLFFLQGRSLTKGSQILVADLYDCLLLVIFFVVLFACCSDRDKTVSKVKE